MGRGLGLLRKDNVTDRKIETPMANTPQSKKRARQSEARYAVNKARRSRIRTFLRKVEEAIASGNPGVSANGEDASQFAAGDDWEGGDLVTAAPQFYQYDWPHQLHARR